MNWYKRALTEDTRPYWRELSGDDNDDYMPNEQAIYQQVEQKFKANIARALGCGDSGCAYMLTNGDVLKVTSNQTEARNAQNLMNVPHPGVVQIKNVWQEGNLWCILQAEVEQPGDPRANAIIEPIARMLDQARCHEPACAYNLIVKMPPFPQKPEILSYVKHLVDSGVRAFDFLNGNNVGMTKDGRLVFFDVT